MKKMESFLNGSSFRSRFLLTQISGYLTWMAFPNVGAYSSLAWICMVFWFLALRKAGWKERLFHGLMFSFWYSLPEKWGIFWKISSTHFLNWWIAFLFFGLFFVCYFIPFIVFSILSSNRPESPFRSIFLRCAAFTALFAWVPAMFPINPALMVHDQPIAMQTADLGGIHLVVFLVLWVNFLVAEMAILIGNDRRQFGYHSLYVALTVVFIVSYGSYRIHEQKRMEMDGKGHYTHIAVLETRFLPTEPLVSLVRQAKKGGYSAAELTELCAIHFPQASVIVWPELPIGIDPEDEPKLYDKVTGLAARLQKSIIYSSMETVRDSTPAIEYCTARLILPDGTESCRYRKRSLIPFYESTPFPILTGEGFSNYQAGKEDTLFPLDDKTRMIPSLCYDLHSQVHLRNGVRQGGNLIVHMSSFYAFDKSSIPFIDYTIAKFYAIEYRVPLIRSTNRGYGAFIQTTGEAVKGSETTPKDRDINSVPMFIPDRRSIYTSIGDTFLYLLTVSAIGMSSVQWFLHRISAYRKVVH